MKYPVLFILRLLVVLMYYTIIITMGPITFVLIFLWTFNIKYAWTWWMEDFSSKHFITEDDELILYKKELYYYHTCWDYLIFKKRYMKNPKYKNSLAESVEKHN